MSDEDQAKIDSSVNLHFVEHAFPFGSLVMNGPYWMNKVCQLGDNCAIHM